MQIKPLLAHKEASRLSHPVESVFVGQFLIDKNDTAPISEYLTQVLCDRFIHFCPTLDLTTIKDDAGAVLGFILGIALNDVGQHVNQEETVTVIKGEKRQEVFERFIIGLTGRYIAVSQHGSSPYIYTDAVGEMGVVFDTQSTAVGSTLPLILRRDIQERPDIDHKAVMNSKGHYALGYTRDTTCERLLPNHRLDLDKMCQTRFWPRDDSPWQEASTLDFDEMIDALIMILRQNTIGFLMAKPSVFPLSGGQDSRMLITSARDHAYLAKAIFGMEHNWASGQDCDIGAKVAARLGLNYWRIRAPKLKKWGNKAFHARVGYAANAGGTQSIRHTSLLPQGHLVIRGNVMGLTRANDWGAGKKVKAWDNTAFGIRRLKMGAAIAPDHQPDDLEQRYIAWRDSLPGHLKHRSHDLAFCESYLPNSLGARNYAYTNVCFVNPFASRRAIALVSAVDPQLRKENRINNALLAITAPDLHDIELI